MQVFLLHCDDRLLGVFKTEEDARYWLKVEFVNGSLTLYERTSSVIEAWPVITI